MLDLDFTQEQELLREVVRDMCSELAPLEVVRELEDSPDGIATELWQQFGELGLCGAVAPDASDESSMSLLDAVVIYEELGRSLAPLPHFATCVISAGAIAAAGSASQQAELLGPLTSGQTIATPAWLEPGGGFAPLGVQLTAEARGDSYVLNGVKSHVAFATAADYMVVLARTGAAATAIDLFVVPTTAVGLSFDQQMSISSDTQYRVRFDNVALLASARLDASKPGDGSAWQAWEHTVEVGAILAAAQAVGGASYALEITVDYAKTRRQFNKALAEFQSISHYLADASTALDGARLLVYEAAWAYDADRAVDALAPMAKLFACRTYRDVTAMAQQVFGGIGFTLEYDIQLYFRRAKQLQITWWDVATCEDRIADAILGAAGTGG